MSGLAAVWHKDGRPVETPQIARLAAGIAHRGPDGSGVWHDGSVALAHARLATSRYAARPQPLVRERRAIAFDGRIDNRHDLRAQLEPSWPWLADDISDAALALAAYLRWDEDSAARLIGDFAYVIWDDVRRALVCARDFLGQQPLFYHETAAFILVASEPRAILDDPRVPRTVNEDVVAEHLTGALRSVGATINAAVRRLPPAHVLVADKDRSRIHEFWNFDPAHEVRYRRPDDYGEHFLELLTQSVDCRLESSSGAALFLSGGLDSSAVAAVATPLARERGVALHGVALRFPGRACDEGLHIEAVARHTGIPVRSLTMVPARSEVYCRGASAALDIPPYPNGTICDPLRAAALESGARVAFTGFGGDDWFTGTPAHTTDLLRRGRLLAAWRQLRDDAQLPGRGYRVRSLALFAAAPLLPDVLRAAARHLHRPPRRFDWLTPEFRKRTGVDERRPAAPRKRFASLEQADLHEIATGALTVTGNEIEERAAARMGVDQRHPLNDRRVAEFGLAIPPEQRWSGRETKVVLRRAMRMRRLLPDTVLAREDKAEFSSSYVDALNAFGGAAAFSNLRTAARGWVDEAKVRALHARMMGLYSRNDDAYIPLSDSLWSVLSLELWLGALEAHGTT